MSYCNRHGTNSPCVGCELEKQTKEVVAAIDALHPKQEPPISEQQYYWGLFRVVRYSWKPSGMCNKPYTRESEFITDKHPLQFKNELNAQFGIMHDDAPPVGAKSREEYHLVNWKELTKEEYQQFRDTV